MNLTQRLDRRLLSTPGFWWRWLSADRSPPWEFYSGFGDLESRRPVLVRASDVGNPHDAGWVRLAADGTATTVERDPDL